MEHIQAFFKYVFRYFILIPFFHLIIGIKRIFYFLSKHRFFFFLIPIIFILSIFSNPISLFTNSLKVGELSERTIYASKDIKYIDEKATEQAKQNALDSVGPVFKEDDTIVKNLLSDIDLFFNSLIVYHSKVSELNKARETRTISEGVVDDSSIITQVEYNNFLSDYKNEIKNPFNYKDEEIDVFLSVESEELIRLLGVVQREVKKTYSSALTEDNVLMKRTDFLSDSSFYVLFDTETFNLVLQNIRPRIEPNLILDEEKTEIAKKEALKLVGDVYLNIDKRQHIVSQNQKITEEQFAQLKALGLTESSLTSGSWKSYTPYFSLIMVILYVYFYTFYKESYYKLNHYLFVFGSITIVTVTYNLLEDTIFSFFSLLPVFTIMMLFMVFWNRNLSMFVSLILGFLLFHDDLSSFSLLLLAGAMLVILFPKHLKMMEIIFRSLILGIILFVADYIFYITLGDKVNLDSSLTYLVSAAASSVLTIGMIPLCEIILGIATILRLSEFTDGNHVLLNKLRQNAYGTYIHSQQVRVLCDIACEEVGGNKLLLAVGAMFHDVGKLRNPHLFIENGKSNQSPHDHLDPRESAEIITRHVRDGIEMCKEHNLPKQVIDLIASHHSDNVTNFYYKAKNMGLDISKEQFKYPNPTPKTKEQGILLLADSVEAFSRRLLHKSVEEIKAELENFIYEHIIKKGSLRHCQLTIDEIERIKNAFIEYMPNIVHERSPYVSEK